MVYRFYRDVLGLKPQFEAESGPYAKFSPDTGEAGTALQDRAQLAGMLGSLAGEPEGFRALVVLRVNDLAAAHTEFTSRGAEFARDPGPMGERMRVASLQDPEGNLIELQEWLVLAEQAGSAQTQQ